MGDAIPSPAPVLRNMVVSTIKPLQTMDHVESIDPSFMDLNFSDLYVPVLFAYRLADKSDGVYLQLINRMKASLEKVLVLFFSFAGRWIAGGSKERLLLCNDEGVPFIEANVDDDMDSVVQTSIEFDAVPELHGYSVVGMDFKFKQVVPPDGLVPIFVQATRFKCGGVVIAVNFTHMHTDLKGFFTFMRAWSDLSRDNETAVKVDDSRGQIHRPSNEGIRGMVRRPSKNGIDGVDCPDVRRPWVLKSFEVSASAITSAKQEAKSFDIGPGFVSTQDCIAAHVWSSLARLPTHVFGGREARISLTVEGRKRFYDPPLPDSYIGNCLSLMLPAKIPVQDLAEEPLASIACKIREQLTEITRREEWFDVQRFREIYRQYESDKCVVMSVTSWFKSPLYEMDFGFGKPSFAKGVGTLWRYVRPRPYTGTASIGPPLPGGSASSIATLSIFSFPEVVQALERDPRFLSILVAQENGNKKLT